MVDQEIVFDTIKKMKESGLEDEIIISTLQDIGLDEPQARELIQKVTNGEAPGAGPAAAPGTAPFAQYVVPAFEAEPQPAAKPASVAASHGSQVQAPTSPFGMPSRPRLAQVQSESIEEDLDDDTAAAIDEAFEGAIQSEQANVPAQTEQPVFGTNQEMLNTIQKIKKTPVLMPQPRETQNQRDWRAMMSPEETISSKAAERVRYHLAEQAEEEAMRHAATQSQLSDQTRQLTEMQSKINKIVKAKPIQMPPGTPPEIIALSKEIEQLRLDVSETKALASATKSLMEKILEANRKILNRLP